MVRTPCCDKSGLKKGTWTPEEDHKLVAYITRYGCWNWRRLPKYAGNKKKLRFWLMGVVEFMNIHLGWCNFVPFVSNFMIFLIVNHTILDKYEIFSWFSSRLIRKNTFLKSWKWELYGWVIELGVCGWYHDSIPHLAACWSVILLSFWRSNAVREELQAAVDELSKTKHQKREL